MEVFNTLGRFVLITGFLLVIVGGLMLLAGKIPGVGRLPGDIFVQRGNFTFYFPVVTGIIISIIITVLLNLFLGLRR
ncbi:DUF2905 domain-containing protein [Desulforudis sp. 1088]|uniref:DUF2905 domain-containing protein n=1 Tax=unclassified Candidatus Desulforudis TaxID=2635950 RepID=UPI00346CC2A8